MSILKFSQAEQEQIDAFLLRGGKLDGVPSKVALHLVIAQPAGKVIIRNPNWVEMNMEVKKGQVQQSNGEWVEDLYYTDEEHQRVFWAPSAFDHDSVFTVEIKLSGYEDNVVKPELLETNDHDTDDLVAAVDAQSKFSTFGSVIDTTFKAKPGYFRFRADDWENKEVWVERMEATINGRIITSLVAIYSNGVAVPWFPSYHDMGAARYLSEHKK